MGLSPSRVLLDNFETGISPHRTSTQAFLDTPIASVIKKRMLELVGIPQYDESICDGLQVILHHLHSHILRMFRLAYFM